MEPDVGGGEDDAEPEDDLELPDLEWIEERGYERIDVAFRDLLTYDPPTVLTSGSGEESAGFIHGFSARLARCENLAERYFRVCQLHGFPREPPWDGPRFAELWHRCALALISKSCSLYRFLFRERYQYDAITGTVDSGRLVELAYILYLRCRQNSGHCAALRRPRSGHGVGDAVPMDIPYVQEHGLVRSARRFSRMRASDLVSSVLQLDYSWQSLPFDPQLVLYIELLELRLADVLFEPHTELVHDREALREPHPGHMRKRVPVEMAVVMETGVGGSYLWEKKQGGDRGTGKGPPVSASASFPKTYDDIDEDDDPSEENDEDDEDSYEHESEEEEEEGEGEQQRDEGDGTNRSANGSQLALPFRARGRSRDRLLGPLFGPSQHAVRGGSDGCETREVRMPLYHQNAQFTSLLSRRLMLCHLSLYGFHRIPTATPEQRREDIPWAYTSARREAIRRIETVLVEMTKSATVEDMENLFALNYLTLSCRPSELEEHALRATNTRKLSFRPVRRVVDAMTVLTTYRSRPDANAIIENSKKSLKDAIQVKEDEHPFCRALAMITLMDRLMFGRSAARFSSHVYYRMFYFNATIPRHDNLAQICYSETPSLIQSFNYFYLCYGHPKRQRNPDGEHRRIHEFEGGENDDDGNDEASGSPARGKLQYEIDGIADGIALWCHLVTRDHESLVDGADLSDSFRKLFGDDWRKLLLHQSDTDPDSGRPITWTPNGLYWIRKTAQGLDVPGQPYMGRIRRRREGCGEGDSRKRRRYIEQVSELVEEGGDRYENDRKGGARSRSNRFYI